MTSCPWKLECTFRRCHAFGFDVIADLYETECTKRTRICPTIGVEKLGAITFMMSISRYKVSEGIPHAIVTINNRHPMFQVSS